MRILDEIFESVPAIVWVADPLTLRFTYVNRAAESILGYPVSRWLNEPDFWMKTIHPDDRSVIDTCRRAIESGGAHELVYRMMAADGRAVWLRDTVQVKTAADGTVELFGAMIDITKERETHHALVRSEENYRRLVHTSPDAIGVHDGERYLFVNPQFAVLFGAKSEADIIGHDIVSLMYPEYLPEVRARQARIARGESVAPMRQKVRRLDGEYAEAEVSAIPVVFNGIKAVQVVARDVTERVQAEERLQLLAAGTSEAIWEVDFATGAFWANDAYRTMFGDATTVEEAYALGVERLHPEDREKTVARINQRLEAAIDQWSDEYRIQRTSGEYVWVLDRGRVVRNDQGKPQRMIGAILDITPLREAEASYRQIFEQVQDVIYTVDVEGRITSLNPAFEKLTGHRIADWIGRSFGEILTPDSTNRGFEHMAATFAGDYLGVKPYQLFDADGRVHDIEASGQPRIVNGQVVGMIGVVRDVTERNRLQRNLENTKRIASLGSLAASIAHEFNNVLMSIQPFTELLLRTSAASPHAESASKHITEAIARGKRITSEILIYANPKEPHLELIEVEQWMDALRTSLRATLPESIHVEVIPVAAKILADRYHLDQVVANLAMNARDAMPGGGTLTVEASADRNHLRLSVRDTGCGIPAEKLPLIWEPLFTTKRTGTGLGLAIAKRLIERQNGSISIDSAPGAGTAFHIVLPLAT